jgi:hypothetical protein
MNANGVQQNILVTQGFVTTLIGLAYAFIPDVSSAYWIFSVMTTQVYLVMYVLMFIAAMQLRRRQPDHERGYRAPALSLLCIVGLLASAAAFFIGFVPPSQFEGGNTATYIAIVGGGVLLIGFILPGATYALRKPSWKTAEAGLDEAEAPAAAQAPVDARLEEAPVAAVSQSIDGGAPERPVVEDHPRRRRLLYGGIGAVLGAVLVWGLIARDTRQTGEEAEALAAQVIAEYENQGLVPPSQDLLVNLLGTDGGNVCVDPGAALNQALHRISLANGGAQVGVRPVIVDSVVQGELVILDVYCPDKAAEARAYLDSLYYDDVVKP